MSENEDLLQELIQKLAKLPGLGRRSAERIAFHLLSAPVNAATDLAKAIRDFRTQMSPCMQCHNLAVTELCSICADTARNRSKIMIVEYPADVQAFEHTSAWDGLYHVLMGRIAPMAGIEPGDVNIGSLLQRVSNESNPVAEIVLATSSTMEGEITANLIADKIRALPGTPVKITRIARGLPSGSEISFAQSGTLRQALDGRKEEQADVRGT